MLTNRSFPSSSFLGFWTTFADCLVGDEENAYRWRGKTNGDAVDRGKGVLGECVLLGLLRWLATWLESNDAENRVENSRWDRGTETTEEWEWGRDRCRVVEENTERDMVAINRCRWYSLGEKEG